MAAPNIWGVTSGSARHQNSLNNHQAVLDPDGCFTVVLSNVDPGVANWLDPGGLTEGIVMLRWQLLASVPSSDQPGVTARTVKLADLPQVLPASAQVSPSWREWHTEKRRLAYARRFELRAASGGRH